MPIPAREPAIGYTGSAGIRLRGSDGLGSACGGARYRVGARDHRTRTVEHDARASVLDERSEISTRTSNAFTAVSGTLD
jgi:hypothetical protein